MKISLYIFTLCFLLSGCANTPLTKAYVRSADTIKINDESERINVAYLAKDLMARDERNDLLEKITKEKAISDPVNMDYLTAATATSLIVDGNIGTTAGDIAGATTLATGVALNILFDGSIDHLSKIYLPASFQDKALLTKENATQAFYEYVDETMKSIANNNHYELSCLTGCKSNNRIYFLKPTADTLTDPELLYTPIGGIVVTTAWSPLVLAEEDAIRDSVLGFKAKWTTEGKNGFRTGFFGDPVYLEDGRFDIRTNDSNLSWLNAKANLQETKFGRLFMRQFYSNPYFIYGEDNINPSQVYYNGKIYGYSTTDIKYFLQYLIVD